LESEARRQRASLPGDLSFRTKIELGAEMLEVARRRAHLRYQWVTGDAGYGDSHDLRQAVERQGKWYCFEVSSDAEVWSREPNWQVPEGGKLGRPRTRKLPTADSPAAVTVSELTATLPETEWVRHRVTEGAKGPREYEFVRARVIEKRHQRPGSWGWMMVRRPVGCRDPKEFKHYLSNAPETVALAEMAWVGCLRWTIEENFELAKGELGLDHYEITKYRGWHHHVTLVMLALAFLKSVQGRWGEKRHLRLGAGDTPTAGGRAAPSGVDAVARDRLVGEPTAPKDGGVPLSSGPMAA
jgi:SRSO17 transposase